MNKKEFLSTLEKRLSILNEEERNDIINEYKDTISEKVKNGQTEEEAIKDFGNIDDLVKELLDAYKINPEYENSEKADINNIIDEGEKLVKQGADKLASASKNLYHRFQNSNKEINLSLVFEILIKIFLVIIALALLRLPFILFENLGSEIFDAFFSPFNDVLKVLWQLCLMILYLIACILIVIATFKKYFENDTLEDNSSLENDSLEENQILENALINEDRKKEKKVSNKDHTTIGDVFIMILKIWIILFVIIPLVFFDCMILIGLCVSIFYFIKGIDLLGLSLLLLGCAILTTYLIKVLFNLVFRKKGITFIPAVIGVVLVVIGSFMFFDMIMNINYIDGVPYKEKMTTKEEKFTVSHDKVYIGLHYYEDDNVSKVTDNSMDDNVVKVKVTYDKNLYDMHIEHNNNYNTSDCDYDEHGYESHCVNTVNDYISLYSDNDENFNNFKKEYNIFIENLKDNKVYSYNSSNSIKVEIIANEKTLNKINL